MQLLNASVGWALTDDGLLRTDDGGDHWTDITPPNVPVSEMSGVWFLDGMHGWAAHPPREPSWNRPNPVTILRTGDGGRRWLPATITAGAAPYGSYGPAYFFFLDASHGWLSFDLGNNTAGTAASLYATEDGGATWTERQIPLNEAVRFSTPLDGWTAGGPSDDRLYGTRDGGRTWRGEALPGIGTSCAAGERHVGLPTFWTANDGALPVAFVREGAVAVLFYRTRDGGRSWQPTTPVCAATSGNWAATDVVDEGAWFAVFPGKGGAYRSRDAGGTWAKVTFKTTSPLQIDYVNDSQGWWRSEDGTCTGAKLHARCTSSGRLWRVSGDKIEPLQPKTTPRKASVLRGWGSLG